MHTLSSVPKLTVSAGAMLSTVLIMNSRVGRHELGTPSTVLDLLRIRYTSVLHYLEASKDVD